jgi:hypothetical protein
MDFTHIIANERPKDDRDLMLGAAVAPPSAPYLPDHSWLVRNFQGQTTYCGGHAASHFKSILDYYGLNGAIERKTPRFIEIKLKDPNSPVYDGFAPSAGTDMRSIFRCLQKLGAADFEPLENDVTLPVAQYLAPTAINVAVGLNAGTSTIENYAFGATDFNSLCALIEQNKAVLLLIKCDDGFWGTATPTFTTPKYGHFVVGDGFDLENIRFIDSAEPNPALWVKMVNKKYITSVFILESGTAIDPAQAQAIKSAIVQDSAAVVQDVAQDPIPVPQKESILEEIVDVVEELL